MTSNARLQMSLLIIMISAAYGVIVAKDPQIASAIASGYVGVILTVLILVNVWKRP